MNVIYRNELNEVFYELGYQWLFIMYKCTFCKKKKQKETQQQQKKLFAVQSTALHSVLKHLLSNIPHIHIIQKRKQKNAEAQKRSVI